MPKQRKALIVEFAAGLVFIFAGLRDFFIPNFLTFSPYPHSKLSSLIVLGIGIALSIASWHRIRHSKHATPSQI